MCFKLKHFWKNNLDFLRILWEMDAKNNFTFWSNCISKVSVVGRIVAPGDGDTLMIAGEATVYEREVMITPINHKMMTSEDTFNVWKKNYSFINQLFCWSSFDRVAINKWMLISLVYFFYWFSWKRY